MFSDTTGNYLGVDVDPGPLGKAGQVVLFGADFDDVQVVFDDLAACLLWAAELLSSERVTLKPDGRWPDVVVAGPRVHAVEALLDTV
ncbi:hypothetical protein ACFSC4_20910 [Deinococcus malanensis]|uniref:hypothetical protein n=1 Tax=Deinococcus malanensis TaxID=1706855 RepID=UPI003631AE7A